MKVLERILEELLYTGKAEFENRETGNMHRMKLYPNGQWMIGSILQWMKVYWITSVSVVILTLIGVQIKAQIKSAELVDYS